LQALIGYNLYISDSFVTHAAESPFGYAALIDRLDVEGMNQGLPITDSSTSRARFEAERDMSLLRRSISTYSDDPTFFIKKLLLNSLWFWTLSSTPTLSLIVGLAQGALLVLSVISIRRILHYEGRGSVLLLPVWLGIAYVGVHIPVYALARFSLLLIPTMIAFVAVNLSSDQRKKGALTKRL
jgi:hypothetical protein